MHKSLYHILGCSKRVVRDVVFIVDTGSSRDIQLVKKLVENITINLKVNSPESLFGLITFENDDPRLEFNITNHTDISTLLPAINSGLAYHRSFSTNVANALSLLLSGSVPGGFLQLRNKTSNVAIVITHGTSDYFSSLQLVTNSLHAANIFDVYAVGIGYTSYRNLQLIASNPSFVFSTRSLTNLTGQPLVDDLIEQLCSSK